MENKVAIVTGSSRGIGKGIAEKLLRQGVHVMLNGRNEMRLKEALNELQMISPNVASHVGDVSDQGDCEQLIAACIQTFGRLDILVNNVGVSSRGTIAASDPKVFQQVLNSNFLGAVLPTQCALPHIRKNKGSVVFISSVAGIRGLPGLAPYCASKMALRALAESLRIEEYQSNIHVGLIYVGITEIVDRKESIGPDGKAVMLQKRDDGKAQSIDYVAKKVIRNIKKRRFITTLSFMGKMNAFLQPRLPQLVEWLIVRSTRKIEEKSK